MFVICVRQRLLIPFSYNKLLGKIKITLLSRKPTLTPYILFLAVIRGHFQLVVSLFVDLGLWVLYSCDLS